MPNPPYLSIRNMANRRQVADDSIYIVKGGKIDIRGISSAVGNLWRENEFRLISTIVGRYRTIARHLSSQPYWILFGKVEQSRS